MPPQKIKLKTSLKTINEKATLGKNKSLPKLKVILANPYKFESPKLTEIEAQEVQNIIHEEITKLGVTGREFIRKNHICLGLASSLRAINNRKASCVFVSQAIKPKFIIQQIQYFASNRNSSTPVCVVPNLDVISEKLFGTKSLAIVFPFDLQGKLWDWISRRTKPSKKVREIEETVKESRLPLKPAAVEKLDLSSVYLRKLSNNRRAFVPATVVKSEKPKVELKQWTGDFISFSNTTANCELPQQDREDFEKEKEKVLSSLQKMANISSKKAAPSEGTKRKQETPKAVESVKLPKIEWEESDDEYYGTYVSLQVNKIQPNPAKKKKAKRKAKKKALAKGSAVA